MALIFPVRCYVSYHSQKDTIRDFDYMPNAFPGRCQVSFVPQANLISLHQSHIWRTADKERHTKYYIHNFYTIKMKNNLI